ncbi:DUF3299 domain-containing protein [Vibrio astriarenae]|uniref:DUF3299 domain-containing protein n=1 Tax=Vibrio astriarenae TaxID=1481923 RepID=A0A7Z2YDA6_9VIBR|nr:DUF3299 domain-containing protein [Vibrio astriarenae]QIA63198.1 DUF3299 domain-containing protein [Vibrio astriarenae]
MKTRILIISLIGLAISGFSHASTKILPWTELVPLSERNQHIETMINHDLSLDERAPQQLIGTMVSDLNNTQQTVAGFVVPLEISGNKIQQFLLVPFFGACLHVPPPPPNQIILVNHTIDYVDPWEPVVLDGTLKVEQHTQDSIQTGYRLNVTGNLRKLQDITL